MRKGLVVLAAMLVGVTSFAVAASAAPSSQTASSKTIVAVAAGDQRFTTVFAPTNAAFAKLKAQAPDTFEAVSTDKALLTKVLTYHVLAKRVPGTAALAAAKQGASVKTVERESIKLSVKSGKIVLNGSSRVVVADVKASNGVIHAIDAVLVPPSIAKG